MTLTILLTSFIVLSLPVNVRGYNEVKIYEFSHNASLSYPGYRFVDHTFQEFSTKRQVIHCAYECLKSTRCRSFNYEREHQMCQLNDADHVDSNSSLKLETNGTSYEYHHRSAFMIDQDALGPCAFDPCENGGRCLDTVNADMERIYYCLCIDEWTGTNCELPVNRIDWDDWKEWGPCSVTCETGWTVRHRRCMDLETGETMHENKCYGRNEEFKSCRMDACPRWEVWSEWSVCSTTDNCGRGLMHRYRTCSNGGTPGEDRYCLGFTNETAPCRSIDCAGLLMISDIDKHGDGRIEILNDLEDVGMSICADEGWNFTEIDIACRQIGFEGAHAGAALNMYDVNSRVPASPMYKLQCVGTEKTIQKCHREPVEDCGKLGGIQCRIKGGWSLWSNWGECSVTCENGTRVRSRECNHPPANYDGTPCPGDASQSKPCTKDMCPVDGIWTTWAPWSECDVTCENGTRFRTRACIGPFHDGAECSGSSMDNEECTSIMCPEDGVWNSWESWSECSLSCGHGSKNRSRSCRGPFHGGLDCQGDSDDTEACNTFSCPVDGSWRLWTTWGDCSVSCGGGTRIRTRECNLPEHGGETCTGPSEEEENCSDDPCPIDGVYAEWEPWTACTVTCANGTRSRIRECFGPYNGGAPCPGESDETEICVTESCPVDGVWDVWQPWQQCNVTCGGGRKLRQRECIGPLFGGNECIGETEEWDDCNTFSCAVDGEWNQWGQWQTCNVTCGGGSQQRTRTCIAPLHGGKTCEGEDEQWQTCNANKCPVDGEWNTWESWSVCSHTCGGGNKTRIRICHQPLHGGDTCEGVSEETTSCNIHDCPVDGVWELWSNWTECTRTCNSGVQTRNRTCTGPFHGGANCSGEADELRACNEEDCPIDGIFTEWSGWSQCSHTCGQGTTSRNRTCFGPYFGGAPCDGPDEENEFCNSFNCPVDGIWGGWTEWDTCYVMCDGAMKNRSSVCTGPFHGGMACEGPDNESHYCNTRPCPVDGVFNDGESWGECSHSCGTGQRERLRACDGPYYGGANCTGSENDVEHCNTYDCPVDGVFTYWSAWGDCEVTCGGGTHFRNRSCEGPFYGGNGCEGNYTDSQACNTQNCPVDGVWLDWQAWEICSVTCGGGERTRVRACEGPFYDGAECVGPVDDTEECGSDPCPIPGLWLEWSPWTVCTVTCGGGTRHRERECDMDSFGSLTIDCLGQSDEIGDCHTFNCLPYAKHCAEWAERGLNQSTIADVDPDGDEIIYENVEVECDFDTQPGIAVTLIHHREEGRYRVNGYEGAGEYQMMLNYTTGWGEAIAIIDASAECAQFISWECYAAIIHNPFNPDMLTTFWMNRTEQMTNYFGGATPGSGNCACGETNSCANASLPCNCDQNDEVWRVDEGFVTNKIELPIHSFYAGDTGASFEDGYSTIGPVLCSGFA